MRYTLLLLSMLVLACGPDDFHPDFNQESTMGYRPIYADSSELNIGLESARNIVSAGKIYSYGNLLLVNEVGKGLHVYDNTDPRKPVNKFFVTIPGNHDMAMKDGVLYADNYDDLLALQVSSDTVIILKRLEDVIGFTAEFPSQNNVYFECVEEGKGIVVGWEQTMIEKPKCYKP